MPKCEIFDLFDFNDFYVIKSLKVRDLRAEKINFFIVGQIRIILSLLAYVQCTLTTEYAVAKCVKLCSLQAYAAYVVALC